MKKTEIAKLLDDTLALDVGDDWVYDARHRLAVYLDTGKRYRHLVRDVRWLREYYEGTKGGELK